MTFSTNNETVMHTTTINYPSKKMNDMALLFNALWKTLCSLWAAPATVLSSIGLWIFGDNLWLNITGIEGIASVCNAIVMILVSGFGLVLTIRQKKVETTKLEHEEQKLRHQSYRENLDWLVEKGYLPVGATREERLRVYAEFFPDEKE